MKASVGRPLLLLTALVLVATGQRRADCLRSPVPSAEVAVTVAPQHHSYPLGGPIGLTVTITNQSGRDMACDFTFPTPPGLNFPVPTSPAVPPRSDIPVPIYALGRDVTPTLLRAHSTSRAVLYLNRFFTFSRPGTYRVPYRLTIAVWRARKADTRRTPDAQSVTAQGVLTVRQAEAPPAGLDRTLREAARGLDSPDRDTRREALEALSTLDTPQALPYLARAIRVNGLGIDALRALNRVGSPAALQAAASALAEPDPSVVETALDVLAAHRYRIPAPMLTTVVQSGPSRVRFAALAYIAAVGGTPYSALVASLLQDKDVAVAEAARRVVLRAE